MHDILNCNAVRHALRWQEAVKNQQSAAILKHLLAIGATNPQNAVTYSAIARALGLHKWQVKRLIAGERKRRSLLQGLVHYPERYKRGCYLTPEGVTVAKWLTENDPPTYSDLKALAEARQRRIAKSHAKSHAESVKSHTFLYYMTPYLNECPRGDASKPADELAERLWRVYGMALSVANSVVTCYERDAIHAAIELRERKNGAIYNPAGFILHLLKSGAAKRYAEAKRARQDPDLLAQKVKEAVEAQTGVKVTLIDGSPAIDYKGGWLHLPLDPDSAIDLVRRLSRPNAPLQDEPTDAESIAEATNEPDLEAFDGFPDASITEPPVSPQRQRNQRCPRCGAEGYDLPIKRFERHYRQVPDAEAERWDGKEVCDKCLKDLRLAEVRAFAELSGIDLSEPAMPPIGSPKPPASEPVTEPLRTGKPTAIGAVLSGFLPTEILWASPEISQREPTEAAELTEPTPALSADATATVAPDPLQAHLSPLPDEPESDGLTDELDLPEPTCQRCGRKEGEPHHALRPCSRNNLQPLSELSEPIRRKLGVGDFGLVCRGCLTETLKALIVEGDPQCPA